MAKDSRGFGLFSSCIAAVIAGVILLSSSAHAAVGRTTGSFKASPSGAATYTIPIFTPPGPQGIQPSITLAYSSSGGTGVVGRGWSITGISAIARCGKIIAQDGEHVGIGLVGTDGYCLDGSRLKLTAGTYGANGSEWATEVADFSRVTAISAGPSWPIIGPDYWVVDRKDGTKWTYGTTTGSSVSFDGVVHTWFLAQIEDRSGNKIKFTYKAQGTDAHTVGTTHPVKVEWTQTSAGSGVYLYSIDFDYTSNGNTAQSSYSGSVSRYNPTTGLPEGFPVTDTDLLASISVKRSGATLRKYVLGYDISATTGAKRLTGVTECSDAAASDCLSPTAIGYQDGQAGIASTPSLSTSISSSSDIGDGNHDFDGDGFNDLITYRGGVWYVSFGSSTGYGSEISSGLSELNFQAFKPFGTSKAAILARIGSSSYATWNAYAWNGSAFASTSTGIVSTSTNPIHFVNVRDVDADGREDLVFISNLPCTSCPAPSGMGIGIVPSTSTGGSLSFGTQRDTGYVPAFAAGAMYTNFDWGAFDYDYSSRERGQLDLNGDGRGDLLVYGSIWYYVYNEYFEDYIWEWAPFNAGLEAWGDFQYGEYIADTSGSSYGASLNSDGCLELYSAVEVTFSDCAGGGSTFTPAGTVVTATDWNGDGRQDILVSISGTTYVQLSTGKGLSSPIATGIPACVGTFVDANGDGLTDYVCRNGTSLDTYLRNGSTIVPDLAVSFTDGLGVNQTVAYGISTFVGYTAYSNASFPEVDVTSPMVMARTVTASDGAGGTFTTTYTYFGATEELNGRGFQGFDKVQAVDSRNGVKTVYRFKRGFPYSGSAYEVGYYQSDDTPIRKQTATMAYTTLESAATKQRYHRYRSATSEDVYEVEGTRNGAWISHTDVSYSYDAWGNVTASTKTITDKDANSPLVNYSWSEASAYSFSPSTTHWCVGLPTSATVTHSATTLEATVIQSRGFTPDYAKCRYDNITAGTGAGQVDYRFEYDSFGNIDLTGVTGRTSSGGYLAERVSEVGWGATGQFPAWERNAESHEIDRTFDDRFGALESEFDPNDIRLVFNVYNAFGRLAETTRPDDTSTVFDYAHCSTLSACINGDPATGGGLDRTIVIAGDRDSSTSLIRQTYTHLDMFDRPIIVNKPVASGGHNRVSLVYDEFGHVQKESAPCDNGSCTQYWTTKSYDLLGRLEQASRRESQGSSTPVTTSYLYEGQTRKVVDPLARTTTKISDVKGKVRTSKDPALYYQNFSYDAAGNLKQVSDSVDVLFATSYIYNGSGAFPNVSTDMDLGTWDFDYNSLGELTHWMDAKGQLFDQQFDKLSRLTSRYEDHTGTTAVWTWDVNPDSGCGSYDIGRLFRVAQPGYEDRFCHDAQGRVKKQTVTTDQSYDIDYTYTGTGMLDTMSFPTSTSSTRVKVKYGYAYGHLQTVTDWTSGSAGTVYWTANAQNPRGQITQETMGNGVVTNRNFDLINGWVGSIQSSVSGGPILQNHAYAYDLVGNVTQRQENTLGLNENFYYDNLYRLDYSRLNGVTNLDITYADNGNITARSDVNGGAGWGYHGVKKHAVTSTGSGGPTYTYDGNGNMITRNGEDITWTSYNFPATLATATESTEFSYGPDQQYYKQYYSGPSGTEITHYVGGILEKVSSGGVVDWRHYIKAQGRTVAVVSRKDSGTNAVNYPLEDHQRSGSHLTDSSGAGTVRQSYTAFGLPRDGADWDGPEQSGDQLAIDAVSRRGYTSHSMLGNMGLTHMNGRVQDSITGRFLSPDPNVFQPDLTQGYNRYAYVNNNPLRFIDPSGFGTEVICTQEPVYEEYFDFEVIPWNEYYNLWRYTGDSRYLPTGHYMDVCWNVNVPDPNEPTTGSGGSGPSPVAGPPAAAPTATPPANVTPPQLEPPPEDLCTVDASPMEGFDDEDSSGGFMHVASPGPMRPQTIPRLQPRWRPGFGPVDPTPLRSQPSANVYEQLRSFNSLIENMESAAQFYYKHQQYQEGDKQRNAMEKMKEEKKRFELSLGKCLRPEGAWMDER